MAKPLLIVITGPPCSGKTSIGQRISSDLGLPIIGKDDIKETLFDALGWKDRAWSRKLSGASYELIYMLLDKLLAAGGSCIVDSNFKNDIDSERLQAVCQKHNAVPLQIWCKADGQVLLNRFRERWKEGRRHPGHVDDASEDELKDGLLRGEDPRLDIGGTILEVDTTDLDALGLEDLVGKVAAEKARLEETTDEGH